MKNSGKQRCGAQESGQRSVSAGERGRCPRAGGNLRTVSEAASASVINVFGELAVNEQCDEDSRSSAVAFLGEMYQHGEVWGYHTNIKQLILDILMQLSAMSRSETLGMTAKALLQEWVCDQDKIAFERLTDGRFTQKGIEYLKGLATAIFQNQSEHSLVRAVYEPQKKGSEGSRMMEPTATVSRQWGVNWDFSFENQGKNEEMVDAVEHLLLKSPLGCRSFVGESSILQLLAERVQQ
ncbi:hypothetical protein EDD21DRAFT_412111 [Dissophora ornata]|nr:hypothetical protein EDD21DRAFT_412111 [Dissophora ornata]